MVCEVLPVGDANGAAYTMCALHEHHAAHTCCKLLKKFKNTNLFETAQNECVTFQRVKVPYGRVKFPNR